MKKPPETSLGRWVRRRRSGVATLAAIVCAGAAGCGEERTVNQSAVHPAGPGAQTIADLWWFLFVLLSIVFIVTIVLMLIAVFRRPHPTRRGPPMGTTMFVVVSGVLVPAVILVIMLFASVGATVALRPPDEAEGGLRIRVVGHQFWWEVSYPDLGILSANQIRIPVGEPVRFELLSGDVIHSFWVPNLSGKMDLVPDHANHFWLRADREGVFRGQCAEYCGVQHANMAFMVIAMPPEEFRAWAQERASPPGKPEEPLLARGHDVFFGADAGCYACHAIAGTGAVGRLGPDLTHMGSRLTLGAGMLPNTRENLAAWIVDPQAIKPGNRMPGTVLPPEDLEALVEYLASLK